MSLFSMNLVELECKLKLSLVLSPCPTLLDLKVVGIRIFKDPFFFSFPRDYQHLKNTIDGNSPNHVHMCSSMDQIIVSFFFGFPKPCELIIQPMDHYCECGHTRPTFIFLPIVL